MDHTRGTSVPQSLALYRIAVAIYVNDDHLNVTRLALEGSTSLDGVRAVAVVAELVEGFDMVKTMETRLFQHVAGKAHGASIAFDGGGDGVAEAASLSAAGASERARGERPPPPPEV
eukprot:1283027-Prymnesium_polylepis.2